MLGVEDIEADLRRNAMPIALSGRGHMGVFSGAQGHNGSSKLDWVCRYTLEELDAAYKPWRDRMRKLDAQLQESGLFPALLVFYRAKPGKLRKQSRKGKTADQNNNQIATWHALSIADIGTARRNLKHKGYPELIAISPLSAEEIAKAKKCYRYIIKKYKSFSELRACRHVFDPEWLEACHTLEETYPCQVTGQLRIL